MDDTTGREVIPNKMRVARAMVAIAAGLSALRADKERVESMLRTDDSSALRELENRLSRTL